jgi:hypothetical protein
MRFEGDRLFHADPLRNALVSETVCETPWDAPATSVPKENDGSRLKLLINEGWSRKITAPVEENQGENQSDIIEEECQSLEFWTPLKNSIKIHLNDAVKMPYAALSRRLTGRAWPKLRAQTLRVRFPRRIRVRRLR